MSGGESTASLPSPPRSPPAASVSTLSSSPPLAAAATLLLVTPESSSPAVACPEAVSTPTPTSTPASTSSPTRCCPQCRVSQALANFSPTQLKKKKEAAVCTACAEKIRQGTNAQTSSHAATLPPSPSPSSSSLPSPSSSSPSSDYAPALPASSHSTLNKGSDADPKSEVSTEVEDTDGCRLCGSVRVGHLCTRDVEGRAKLQARNALTLSCVRAPKKKKTTSESAAASDSAYQCHRCLKRHSRSSFSNSQIKRGRNACCNECVKNFPPGGYLGTSDEQLRRQDINILSLGRTHALMDPALVKDVVAKGKEIHSILDRYPNAAKLLLDRAASVSASADADKLHAIPHEQDAPWWLPEEYTAESLGIDAFEDGASDDDGEDASFDAYSG